MYSLRDRDFGAAERDAAAVVARQVTDTIQLAVRQLDQAALSEQLREALATRSVISQAVGVLMGRNGCDADTAFGLLRAESQQRNIKVRVLAEEVVSGVNSAVPPPVDAG